jgi:hypothetical protein
MFLNLSFFNGLSYLLDLDLPHLRLVPSGLVRHCWVNHIICDGPCHFNTLCQRLVVFVKWNIQGGHAGLIVNFICGPEVNFPSLRHFEL